MCRFLLIKSKKEIAPQELLNKFADMAKNSRAPDGDRQGDGWGVAYKNPKSQIPNPKKYEWNVYKSLKPVWEDREAFHKIPAGSLFAVHARSASFPNQKGNIEYNQPYISNGQCFVFNGVLQGVKLTTPLAGEIGAQKIFSLFKLQLKTKKAHQALQTVDETLQKNTRRINGLNVGFLQDEALYVLCDYFVNADYFGVRYSETDDLTLVCSEPLAGFEWQQMKKGEVKVF